MANSNTLNNLADDINEILVIEVEESRMMSNVFEQARMSVCKVNTNQYGQGTGGFYKVIDRSGKIRFLFITCHHTLPTNSLNEISQAEIEFEDIKLMKNIKLESKYIKHIWTCNSFDTTVIEISEKLANLFMSYGAKFLDVRKINDKERFVMLQYSNGKFEIAYGEIIHIKNNKVFYQIKAARGSSGSPLLDKNCAAFAIQMAGDDGASGDKPENRAFVLSAIVEAYLNEKVKDADNHFE